MARYMRQTGVLAKLGVPDRAPRHPLEVHRELAPTLVPGLVKGPNGQKAVRAVLRDVVKYGVLPKGKKGAAGAKGRGLQFTMPDLPGVVVTL